MFIMYGKKLELEKKDNMFTVWNKFIITVRECSGDSVYKNNFICNVKREVMEQTSYIEKLQVLSKYCLLSSKIN